MSTFELNRFLLNLNDPLNSTKRTNKMTNKINTLAALLASTFLSSNATAADTNFYTLTPAAAAGDNTVTLYDITETTRYYDLTTGKEVAAADRKEGTEYKEVVIKNAAPKYYTLGLTSKTYGSGDISRDYNIVDGKLEVAAGTGDITAYTQSGNRRLTNKGDAGDIDGSYTGLSYSAAKSPYGGAVYNNDNNSTGEVKINNITGDFVANSVADTADSTTAPGGGAIYNKRGEINEISGNFIGNSASRVSTSGMDQAQGGAIANTGTINKISGNFAYNYAENITGFSGRGGAVANINGGTISEIDGVFIGNTAKFTGGAVYNGADSTINSIKGTFIGNTSEWSGGAIDSYSAISSIDGTFINNNAVTGNGGAIHKTNSPGSGATQTDISGTFIGNKSVFGGGAVSLHFDNEKYSNNNNDKKSTVSGTFIGNSSNSSNSNSYSGGAGGAVSIRDDSDIGLISGDFTRNTASFQGGAIHVSYSNVDVIDGNFYNNQVTNSNNGGGAISASENSVIDNIKGIFYENSAESKGGAISVTEGKINNIEGSFIGNSAYGDAWTNNTGGAIYVTADGSIETINNSCFINNHSSGTNTDSKGGAVSINGYDRSNKISTVSNTLFAGNYAVSEKGKARGGAIFIDDDGAEIGEIINSSFIDNYAKGNKDSAGGAIYAGTHLNITADNGTSLFSGNKSNDKSNAVFIGADTKVLANLTLSAVNNGVITFDDGIDGKVYNINLTGDGTGEIALNNLVENATALTIDNTALRLGTNGNVNAKNMSGSGTIKVDVTFADNNQIQTGIINAADELTGDYKVIANPLNDGSADYVGASSVFLTAPNDGATFDLARVIGSPYVWGLNKNTDDQGFNWSLELTDFIAENQTIVPEVIASAGLHEAAIEQTRSLVRNIRTKVADNKIYCPDCGIMDYGWQGNAGHNAWVNVQGETATIDKPAKMDADIWGVEAGFDIQNDIHNTLGVFASYRKGEYDLSGKADKLRSNIGSEIDIDSYLAGLYYRYDKNMNWLFATVYGGVQQADAKTDDKIAKFDTDGIEFGAGIEAGHSYELSDNLILEPSLGLYYTQVNFDDAKDNVGKEYDWKDIKHLEAELGAKLEKQIDYAKIYVKPSVIQTITSGDSVKITGLNKLSTYDDATLGRIELGGRYGFTDALSAYGWVNYTFGADYDATAFGAGVSYAW